MHYESKKCLKFVIITEKEEYIQYSKYCKEEQQIIVQTKCALYIFDIVTKKNIKRVKRYGENVNLTSFSYHKPSNMLILKDFDGTILFYDLCKFFCDLEVSV